MLLDATKETLRFLTDLPPRDAGREEIRLIGSAAEWQERLGANRPGTVVTIGNFDGVHIGHQAILRDVVDRAATPALDAPDAQKQLLPAVLTFYPHPTRVLRPQQAPSLLETLPQRLADFAAMGVSAALVLQFDTDLAQASAEDFAKWYLAETMRARAVLVGASFRFGHKQLGDVELLKKLGQRLGFEVAIVAPVIDGGDVVSSTAIREAVRGGRVEDARRMLGRPFALVGEIRTGTGQGRKLVVPTLNLATEQETLPKTGVYVTETVLTGGNYRSVTNVGVRPTFDGKRLAIESHLFDFGEALTAGQMKIRFLQRLRDEEKFSGPEALREQVLKDISRAKEVFAQAQF
ncbi:MAG: bifunctional riboflavin kinase/FAD synthetase [Candidatus Acidiferrales bacterium]|jgi:riboflavin kinase / FMN adenylyltransferase